MKRAQQLQDELERMLFELSEAKEVVSWAQCVLTAFNVGDVKRGSPLHLKLREVMIAYRKNVDVETKQNKTV